MIERLLETSLLMKEKPTVVPRTPMARIELECMLKTQERVGRAF
jgi:hypothetical protein